MTTVTTTHSPADPFTYGGRGGKQRLIPDESTGEMRPYQRVSPRSPAPVSDSSGLLPWKAWMTLKGAAVDGNEHLVQQALHAERTPAGVIDQLAEAGGSKTAGRGRHPTASGRGDGTHRRGPQWHAAGGPGRGRRHRPAGRRPGRGRRRRVRHGVATRCRLPGPATSCSAHPTGSPSCATSRPAATCRSWTGPSNWLHTPCRRYWVDGARGDWVAPTKPRLVLLHAPQDGSPPKAVDIDVDAAKRAAMLAVEVREIRKELR